MKHGQCGRSLELLYQDMGRVAALEGGDQLERCYSVPEKGYSGLDLDDGMEMKISA